MFKKLIGAGLIFSFVLSLSARTVIMKPGGKILMDTGKKITNRVPPKVSEGIARIRGDASMPWAKDVAYTYQYDDGTDVYYCGHMNPGDTVVVWFHPIAATKVIAADIMFYSEGDIHLFVWGAAAGFDYTQYFDVHDGDPANGGNPPGPSPLGANLLATYGFTNGIPITITSSDIHTFKRIDITSYISDTIDVGTSDFFVGFVVDGTGAHPYDPAILADANDDVPYHSLTYLSNPGYPNNSTPGWWAYGIDYMFRCEASLYSNPPPFVDLKKKSDTYLTGPVRIYAHIWDLGIPTDSAGVAPGTAKLYYTVNSGALDSITMTRSNGDSTDGEYYADIPGQTVGDNIEYYVLATDIQGAADDPSLATKYNYVIRAGTPGSKVLFVNEDDYYGGDYTYKAINAVYPNADTWNVDSFNGPPDSSVLFFPDYQAVVWVTWGGAAFTQDTATIKKYLDNGGKMVISSQDLIGGGLLGGVYTDTTLTGGFAYDYLKVGEVIDDYYPNGTDSSQMVGVSGDPISGDFTGGIWVWPYSFASGYNFYGIAHPRTDEAVNPTTIFNDEGGNPTGYKYGDATTTYKLVYLYWPYYYIYKDAAATQVDKYSQIKLIGNALTWLGVTLPPAYFDPVDIYTTYSPNHDVGINVVSFGTGLVDTFYAVDTLADTVRVGLTDNGSGYFSGTIDFSTGGTPFPQPDSGTFYPITWWYGMTDTNGSNTYSGGCYVGTHGSGTHVLFVDDAYPGFPNCDYSWVLDTLGVPYDHYGNTYWYGKGDTTIFSKSQYDIIVWEGSYDWYTPLTQSTATNMLSYFLDNGGAVILTSDELLGDWTNWTDGPFTSGDFIYDYFGVNYVHNDLGIQAIHAIPGDTLTKLLQPVYGNVTYADFADIVGLDPSVASKFQHTIFKDQDGNCAGVHIDFWGTPNSNVFLPFEYTALDTNTQVQFLDNYFNYVAGIPTKNWTRISSTGIFAVSQNFPNPVRNGTTIRFSIPTKSDVELKIYDVVGRNIATLINGEMKAGVHTLRWNGKTDTGTAVANGVYFYRLKAGKNTATRKMVVLR